MNAFVDGLRWLWWTIRAARHRHRLPAERPGDDAQWKAWLNDQTAADHAEEGRHG